MSSTRGSLKRTQREHRPDRLGPRVFARGRWMAIDLRPWDGGKPTMRNPKAAGWPAKGERTESPEIAERWKWAYVDHFQQIAKARALGKAAKAPVFSAAMDEYLEERSHTIAPNTWQNDRTGLRLLVSKYGADTRMDEVTPDMARKWTLQLVRRYQASTVRQYMTAIRQFFAWAKVADPFADVQMPTVENTEARAWTDEELQVVRGVASGMGLRREVELALATGGRKQELFALEWPALDERSQTVRFTRQADTLQGGTRRLKSNKARTAVVLPSWWEHHQPGAKGRVLERVPTRRDLNRILDAAGLNEPGVGWHSFRHTYARIFLDMTHDILLLKESLGHASVAITERRYKHFSTDRAAEKAVELIYGKRGHLRAI